MDFQVNTPFRIFYSFKCLYKTKFDINDQSFHLKKTEKEQIKANIRRRKGIIDEWNSMQYKTE